MDGSMETLPDGPGLTDAANAPTSTARKRVSQACKPCGIKKVKCDGVLPICGSCRNRGVACEYGESKRRNRHRYTGSPRPRSSLPPPPYFARDEVSKLTPATPDYSYAGNHLATHTKTPKSRGPVSTVPAELSTRLIQNYFNYIHPLWPILYKPLYASLDYGNPTHMMPPALVSAIYAMASCIDKPQKLEANTIVPRTSDPDTFFHEATELMEYDEATDSWHAANSSIPSITNCQTLTILALQQHGVAEYSRAAILCGMASAMAIELRLNRPDISGDPIQAEVCSRLWWNLYILEKMMSCEMGRPVLLRAEETDCPIPSVSEADEFDLMSTYAWDQGSLNQTRNTAIKLRTISGLHTTIRLAIIMERVSREIYGLAARESIRADQQCGEAKRLEIWSDLRTWERAMEESPLKLDLSEDLTSVPSAITNYVAMWHGTILLHRPFIARWVSKVSESSANPLEICLHAANQICMILEKYFDRLPGLPCDMVFSVFTAASMLLYDSKQSRKEDSFETRRRLNLCIHWLSVLGKSWKTAGARHKLLADMFDLPQDLKPNGQLNVSDIPTPVSQATPHQNGGTTPFTAINGTASPYPPVQHVQADPSTPEDWSFLQNFGDSTDEFYTLDVELRGLLDGELTSGSYRF